MINKQLFELLGITNEDYIKWCKENHKSSYKLSTKTEFIKKIQDGKIIKKDGKIVKKGKQS